MSVLDPVLFLSARLTPSAVLADADVGRRCARRFIHMADGGIKVVWTCGAEREFPDETAVDVEYLADHLPAQHHHKHHLTHKE